jgi:hypothetical protein
VLALIVAMTVGIGAAAAEPIELVCKGDSYVFVNNAWQKLDGMQVRIQLDMATGQIVEYPLARNLNQFTLQKSEQLVNFTRKILFAEARVVDETLQINRMSGKMLHLLVDPRNGQKQTVFAGKCSRGRTLF